MAPPIKSTENYGSVGITVGGGFPNWGELKSDKYPRTDQAPNHTAFHAGGKGALTVPVGETGKVKFRFGLAAEYVYNGRETEKPAGVLPTKPVVDEEGNETDEPFAPPGDAPQPDPENPPDEPLPPDEPACFPGDPCAEEEAAADATPPPADTQATPPTPPPAKKTSPKDYNYSGEDYHATSHGVQITGSADVVYTPIDTPAGENTFGLLAGAQLAFRHMEFVGDGRYPNGDERVPLALVNPAWGTHQVLKSSNSWLAGPKLGMALDTKNVDASVYGYALWSITSSVNYEVPGREVPVGAEESNTLPQSHSLEEVGVAADVLFHSARATAPVVPPPPPPEDDKAEATDSRIVVWNSFLDKNRDKIAALGMPGNSDNLRAVWMPIPKHEDSADRMKITGWMYALVIQTGIPQKDDPTTTGVNESTEYEWAILMKATTAADPVARTLTIGDLETMLALEEAKAEKVVVDSESVVDKFAKQQLNFKTLQPMNQDVIRQLIDVISKEVDTAKRKVAIATALKDILDKASIDHLISVAEDLLKPNLASLRFDLVGHSSVDKYADNEALSKRRAELVKAVFVAMGVAADRIGTVEGKGTTAPKYNAAIKKENVKNQRVELIPLNAEGKRVDEATLQTLKTKVAATSATSARDVQWNSEVQYRVVEMDKTTRKATDTHVSFDGADGEWGTRTEVMATAEKVPLKYFHDAVSSLSREEYDKIVGKYKVEVDKFNGVVTIGSTTLFPITNVTNKAKYDAATNFVRERKEEAARIRGIIATTIASVPAAGAGAVFADDAARNTYIDSLKAFDKTLADTLATTGLLGKYEVDLEAKAKSAGLTATNQIKEGTFAIAGYAGGKGTISLEGTGLIPAEIEVRKGKTTNTAVFTVEEVGGKQNLKIAFTGINMGFTYTVYKKGTPATKLGVITVAVVAGAATATYKAETPPPPAVIPFNPTAVRGVGAIDATTNKGKLEVTFGVGATAVDIVPTVGGTPVTLTSTATTLTFEFTAPAAGATRNNATMSWKIVKHGTADPIDAASKYIILTFDASGNPNPPTLSATPPVVPSPGR